MSTKKKKPTIEVPEEETDLAGAAEEVDIRPPEKFTLTSTPGCILTVAFHYVENGADPAAVKMMTKEFKGQTFTDIVKIIETGTRNLVAGIKPKGGYLVKIHPRKLVVQGFSDASGIYQHERAMSALASIIYLIAFGGKR